MMLITLLAIIATRNKNKAYRSALFLQAMITVTLFCFKIILITLAGSGVNDELSSQW